MILDTLAHSSRLRVEEAKIKIPLERMMQMAHGMPMGDGGKDFHKGLKEGDISFICEVKKASPSKGIIANMFPYRSIAKEYEGAGALAISVLTEPLYFKGSDQYLKEIASDVKIPVLRKDFTVDAYQIYEAKVLGASSVLLIAALLTTKEMEAYLSICRGLGLAALVEAHTREEIDSALEAGAKIIGVNNRNLKTFEVDIENCIRLRDFVPTDIAYVAESGIQTPDTIKILKEAGVNGVLIGETLMKSSDKKQMLAYLRGEGEI